MTPPPNVHVDDDARGASGPAYRNPAGGTRVVTIHGSVPGPVLGILGIFVLGASIFGTAWLAGERLVSPLLTLASLCSMGLCSLGAVAALRRAQWARLELARESVVVTTGPLGSRTRIEGWSARAPIVTARDRHWIKPLARLPEWDVLVEDDDGRRKLLATLFDVESALFVVETLRNSFRDASETRMRHPFAAKLGAIPTRVSCEGEADAPGTASWRLEARCPREGLAGAAAQLAFALPLTLLCTGVLVVSVTDRDLPAATCPFLFWLVLAAWTFGLAREVSFRLGGRAVFEVAPAGLVVRVRPWPWPWGRAGVRYPKVLAVTARRKARRPERGVLWLETPQGQRNALRSFPIDADDAEYLARALELYYRAAREAESR